MKKLELGGRQSTAVDNTASTAIEYLTPEKFDELLTNRWDIYPTLPATKKVIPIKEK